MPNIGALLRTEIARLSRKEVRGESEALKRATAQFRHDIAALKRKVSTLERLIHKLERSGRPGSGAVEESNEPRTRFVPKGLVSLRSRLGLSAVELGQLIGVSAQSVYNWEHNVARPRAAQLRKIAELRSLGKKEARARLEDTQGASDSGAKRRRKAPAATATGVGA